MKNTKFQIFPTPAIHLICGFIGFGKTTYAQKLEHDLMAVRFTHDEFMLKHYGCNPDNFQEKYKAIDKFIRREAVENIKGGKDVILDYGFWNKKQRALYYRWAKKITPHVFFHALICDLATARERTLKRTQHCTNTLFIDENCFNSLSLQYESITEDEKYPIIFYCSE